MVLHRGVLCILMTVSRTQKMCLWLIVCCGVYVPNCAMKCAFSTEQVAAAWRYNIIKEKKFSLPASEKYVACNQQSIKRYVVNYHVSFRRDRYDTLVFYLLETITEQVNQGVLGEIFKYCLKFDTKTWYYKEVDERDSDGLRLTSRFNVFPEQNPTSSSIQKVFIKNLATNETIVENHEIDGKWGRLYFPQDLIVASKVDYTYCFSFKAPIFQFSIYALNPWELLRTIRSDHDKSMLFINPNGTQLVMLSSELKTGLVHFRVVEVCIAGYEKLRPNIKGHDARFRFR